MPSRDGPFLSQREARNGLRAFLPCYGKRFAQLPQALWMKTSLSDRVICGIPHPCLCRKPCFFELFSYVWNMEGKRSFGFLTAIQRLGSDSLDYRIAHINEVAGYAAFLKQYQADFGRIVSSILPETSAGFLLNVDVNSILSYD